jgi:hypothetical protein
MRLQFVSSPNLHDAMKTLIALFLMAACPAMAQAPTKGKAPGTPSDEAQIRQLIERETKAFFEIDYATWASCWAHVPHAFWSFADTTDVNYFSGWDNINRGFANYFRTSKPSTATIDREWISIKIYGNGAYARFIQLVNDNSMRPPQEEVRVLEKINGVWKIVCVSVIAIEKEKESRPVR